MSLDFSDVVSITIPEGSVKGIAINGVAVWGTPKILDSITIPSNTKTDYDTGNSYIQPLVTAHYTDGSTLDIYSNTPQYQNLVYDRPTSPFTTVGTYPVNITYTEGGITKTISYTIYIRSFETLWSGTVMLSWNTSSSTVPSPVNVYTNSSLTSGNYRITFGMSNYAGTFSSPTYYKNGTGTTVKPTSPIMFNGLDASTSLERVLGVTGRKLLSSTFKYLSLDWDATNHKFVIKGAYNPSTATSGGSTSGTISITVTKIEHQTGGPTRD